MKKRRVLPKIDKKDLSQISVGYHNIPDWLLILFGIVLICFCASILFL